MSYLDDSDRPLRLCALKVFGLLTMDFSRSISLWSSNNDRIFEVDEAVRQREFRLRREMLGVTTEVSVKGISHILLLEVHEETEVRCLEILTDLWIIHFHLLQTCDPQVPYENYQTLWRSVIDLVVDKMSTHLQGYSGYQNTVSHFSNHSSKMSVISAGVEFLTQASQHDIMTSKPRWVSSYLKYSSHSLLLALQSVCGTTLVSESLRESVTELLQQISQPR